MFRALLCSLLLAATAYGQTMVTVSHVVDGNTFQTDTGQLVVIRGVASPGADSPHLTAAKNALINMILDRPVKLLNVTTQEQHGTLMATVKWRDWDVAYSLIRRGYANANEAAAPPAVADKYVEAAAQARAAGRGFWPAGETGWSDAAQVATTAQASPVIVQTRPARQTVRVIQTDARGLVPLMPSR